MALPDQDEPSRASPFLRLPLEIRRLVYTLLLPHTSTGPPIQPHERPHRFLTCVRRDGKESWCLLNQQQSHPQPPHWRRGNTALLAINQQIHDETASMLYSENTFVLEIGFDKIEFKYRWRMANGLMPHRDIPWFDNFSQKNLLRVRRYVVTVESGDEYTGMIKYNCGGRGLPAGIRANVNKLAGLMAYVRPNIHHLQIHLMDGAISRAMFPSGRVHRVQDEANYAQTQTVLDPFRRLIDVSKVEVSGVSEEYAEDLTRSMTASRGARLD
ncbi:hypothetical protein BDU57DRAFT_518444 [Ampelomyces quisqualis]|uniref:DUF7730 domain-containing protein n=1 Tax=Ampelomyces quisqualis TaxID=50730 RepID=A0A6A5QIN9_AMPQU|nr:hypothetical protein BDU57DRAFT_518444 [Ampelomyces quisqualis]